MRTKLALAKNFGVKTIMEEIKAMAQKIWKMSILYPKTSKKFYHHIKFQKDIMNCEVFYKNKLFLKISQENTCVGVFVMKMQAYRPENLSKSHSNTAG